MMQSKSDRIIQLIVNWILILTSPLWIIPATIYFCRYDLKKIFIEGNESICR